MLVIYHMTDSILNLKNEFETIISFFISKLKHTFIIYSFIFVCVTENKAYKRYLVERLIQMFPVDTLIFQREKIHLSFNTETTKLYNFSVFYRELNNCY